MGCFNLLYWLRKQKIYLRHSQNKNKSFWCSFVITRKCQKVFQEHATKKRQLKEQAVIITLFFIETKVNIRINISFYNF